MTDRPGDDFQRWLTERFDRLDEKLDARIGALAQEIKETRHANRGSMDQLTAQVVRLVEIVNAQQRELAAIEEWRAEGGQLDLRLRRHSGRLDQQESWRNRVSGALAVVIFLFPTTVGIILWLMGGQPQ